MDKDFLNMKEHELNEIFKGKEIKIIIEYHGCSFIKGTKGIKINMIQEGETVFFEIYKFTYFNPENRDSLILKNKSQANRKAALYQKLLKALKTNCLEINSYRSGEYADNKIIMISSGDKYLELIVQDFPENDDEKELEEVLNLIKK